MEYAIQLLEDELVALKKSYHHPDNREHKGEYGDKIHDVQQALNVLSEQLN
jgi:DnaJ-class molecular chaperone